MTHAFDDAWSFEYHEGGGLWTRSINVFPNLEVACKWLGRYAAICYAQHGVIAEVRLCPVRGERVTVTETPDEIGGKLQ